MNYTKININGVEYNLRFGMASFRYLADKNIENFDEIGVSHIIYSGYHNWCLVNEVIPVLKFVEVVDYVESCLQNDMTEVNEVIKVWGENQLIKDATDTKKKTTGKRSKK